MPTLLDLPSELLDEIVQYHFPSLLRPLRETCKTLRAALQPIHESLQGKRHDYAHERVLPVSILGRCQGSTPAAQFLDMVAQDPLHAWFCEDLILPESGCDAVCDVDNMRLPLDANDNEDEREARLHRLVYSSGATAYTKWRPPRYVTELLHRRAGPQPRAAVPLFLTLCPNIRRLRVEATQRPPHFVTSRFISALTANPCYRGPLHRLHFLELLHLDREHRVQFHYILEQWLRLATQAPALRALRVYRLYGDVIPDWTFYARANMQLHVLQLRKSFFGSEKAFSALLKPIRGLKRFEYQMDPYKAMHTADFGRRHAPPYDVLAPLRPLAAYAADSLQYLCLTWLPAYGSEWHKSSDLRPGVSFKLFKNLKTLEADTYHFVISSGPAATSKLWRSKRAQPTEERVHRLLDALPRSLANLILHSQGFTIEQDAFLARLDALFDGLQRLPAHKQGLMYARHFPRARLLPALDNIRLIVTRGSEGYWGSLDPARQQAQFRADMPALWERAFVEDCGVAIFDRVAAHMFAQRAACGLDKDGHVARWVRAHADGQSWIDDFDLKTVYWNPV